MRTYSLDPQKFGKVRRDIMILFAVIGIVAIGFGLWTTRSQLQGYGLLGLIVVPVLIVILIIGAMNTIKQKKAYWGAFRIEMGEDYVIRQEPGLPGKRIQRSEVTSIQETPAGFVLSSAHNATSVIIPKDLGAADFAEIKASVSTWKH